jgi:hypothetical protein
MTDAKVHTRRRLGLRFRRGRVLQLR